MAVNNAIKGQGTTIEVGDGAPGTYNTIGDITDFSGPGGESTEIDVTHLQSDAIEILMGLPDEGDFTLTCNFDPTDTNGQNRCRTLRTNQTLGYFRVTYTDTSTTVATFTGFVKRYVTSGAVNDKVTLELGIRISGAVTFA